MNRLPYRVVPACLLALAACSSGGGGGAKDLPWLQDVPDIPYIHEDASDAAAPDGQGNRPPVLAKVGDRVVAVGVELKITLSADDPDGDPLTYSVYGQIPEGAKFDKASRTLTWVPLQADQTVYLTFVVSDGSAIDRETVQIKVVAEATGHPPAFEKVSDQKVEPGKAFALQLSANDPDGDPLEFGIAGQRPAGADVNPSSGQFAWTPDAGLDGQVVKVTFEVRDPSGLKDRMDVRFLVGDVQAGTPPKFDAVPPQQAKVGEKLAFTVRATVESGGAVALAVESGKPPAATFDAATGAFAWTPGAADAGHALSVTFSATAGELSSYLTVDIQVAKGGQPPACADDAFEPNNTPDAAKPLAPGAYDLSICDTTLSPVDIDFLAISAQKGDTVHVRATFQHDLGDVDIDLSYDGSTDTVVAASHETADVEEFSWTADATRAYVLAVYGIADATYAVPYHLVVEVTAGATCTDDGEEENDDPAHATAIAGTEATLPDLVLCPSDPDVFALQVPAGGDAVAAATPKGGKLTLELLGPDKATVLDQVGPLAGPATVGVEKAAAGTYYARVTAATRTTYTFEALVTSAAGCTAKSCPAGQVCDGASGQCVDEACGTAGKCPDGLRCVDALCVASCATGADCRTGYACKSFPDGEACGRTGAGKSGAACTAFTDCAADAACLFPDGGGYCAVATCTSDMDCPLDAWCAKGPDDRLFCAAECKGAADCTGAFVCTDAETADGATVKLCL